MVRITPTARAQLKRPMGKLYKTLEEVKKLSQNYKIIAVGDVTTLALLGIGIRPHLAVFDYKYMRRKLAKQLENVIKLHFKNIIELSNPPGTVSEEVLASAAKLLKTGGALKIDGEEDLTALAFVKYADNDTRIIYGQPKEGIVIVEPTAALKKKVNWMLGFDKKIINKKTRENITIKKNEK
ncbi:MAG: DUF359 domain-containing protein [Candidatus Micrarchaeota archaeon]|nr:DUF359 domain-containing protein [Candidatus Micrarchaeota archaeon]